MRFEQFVRKYQKWCMAIIVVPLMFGLVLWGNPFQSSGKAGEVIATILDGREVTAADYEAARRKVISLNHFFEAAPLFGHDLYLFHLREKYPDLREKYPHMDFSDRFRYLGFEYQRRNQMMQGAVSEEQLHQELETQTWNHLILFHVARDMNMVVDPSEVQQVINTYASAFTSQYKRMPQLDAELATHLDEGMLEELSIKRLMDLKSESSFESYKQLMERTALDHKKVKILYTQFDAKDFRHYAGPVDVGQILKHAAGARAESKVPEQIQLDYLFAGFKSFKDKTAAPTEEEMKSHFEKNHDLYRVAPEPQANPGDAPPPENQPVRYKAYEDVKNDIQDLLRLKKAEEMVGKMMVEVNLAVGELLRDKKPGENVEIAPLAAKFGIQYATTGWMDSSRIASLEQVLGFGTQMEELGFHRLKEGDFARGVVKTTEGCLIYRLVRKKPEYELALMTQDNRDRIAKKIQDEMVAQAAQKKANEFVQAVQSMGVSVAARMWNVNFQATSHFTPGDRNVFADSGRADVLMEQATQLRPGTARVVDAGDKKFVLYCEDASPLGPKELEQEVRTIRGREIQEKRLEAEDHFRRELSRSLVKKSEKKSEPE